MYEGESLNEIDGREHQKAAGIGLLVGFIFTVIFLTISGLLMQHSTQKSEHATTMTAYTCTQCTCVQTTLNVR